jgi:hypothetical protein
MSVNDPKRTLATHLHLMRMLIFLAAIFLMSNALAGGAAITVKKGTELERELNYSLTLTEYKQRNRISYSIDFKSHVSGKLKKLCELALYIKDDNNIQTILDVPLQYTPFNFETYSIEINNVIDVSFDLNEELLKNAGVVLRTECGLSPTLYYIKLSQYL